MLHQLVTSRWLASHCQFTFCSGRVWRSLEGTPERPLGGASSDELQAIDRLRWIRMPNIFFFRMCVCVFASLELGTSMMIKNSQLRLFDYLVLAFGILWLLPARLFSQKLVIKHMLNIVELFELPLDGALFFSPCLDFILVHQQHHRSWWVTVDRRPRW